MKFMFTCMRFGPLTPSIRNGKTRFWKLAGPFAGSRSNPASTLNQRSSVGSSLGDVVEVAVEEDVAPGEERAGLVFERAADLPAAEDRAEHARSLANFLPGPNGISARPLAVMRCGRPLTFGCHSVGSRSYSFRNSRLRIRLPE